MRVEKRPAVLNYKIRQFESFVYVVGDRKLCVERSVCVNVQACNDKIRLAAIVVAVKKTIYITLLVLIFGGIDVALCGARSFSAPSFAKECKVINTPS